MKRIKRIAGWSFVLLVVALLAAQLVPVSRTNPAVESEVPATAEVRSILRRACYDCHSNETLWPWYSRVAPVSWLVASDVSEGREKMNFSAWNHRTPAQQTKAIQSCWREVERGEMPLWFYLPLHPKARLSEEDRPILRQWSESTVR